MSVEEAAGCALSSAQSVSVGPTITCGAPRDHEQHGLLGAEDQAGIELQAVARDHEMDALGRAHLELAALADEVLDVVGPDAGRVDDLARPHGDRRAALLVAHLHARDPLALAQEAD